MTRFKILIEYDGTNYCGWQRQNGHLTIQAAIEEAIRKFSGEEVQLYAAGRTDTGVHALGQVAHFDLSIDFPEQSLVKAINFYLRKESIIILDAKIVDENFHARFSAKQRAYCYKILNRNIGSPLDQNRVWHVKQKLNLEKMSEASKIILGNHDFSSFRAAGCQATSPIITIDRTELYIEEDRIYFNIYAKSFLYHMVRNIVGTLVKVGREQISIDEFSQIFKNCDRRNAGITAPAKGLYFKSVLY